MTAQRVRARKLVNLTEAARLLHKDASTIRRWADNGMPVERRGEKLSAWAIDIWEVYLWLLAQDRAERSGDPGEVANIEVSKARLAEIRADKEAIELALLRGDAVSIADAGRIWNDLVVTARTSLLSIPGKVAGQLAGETREVACRNIIDDEIRAALTALANYVAPDPRR